MIEVFKKCMTTDFANFSGRARRREYWLFALATFIISALLKVLALFVATTESAALIGIVSFVVIVYSVGILIPSLSVTVRRLHDIGRSGLWLLLYLTVVGGLVIFIFSLLPGTVGDNQYGADPKAVKEA
ncbi:MAG: DUF805 domain-containing protein [Marinilabiliaceae bacterium]